ncbi:putative serine protease 47 [Marmota monax]|uniref:Putative serine protease 47 n=2 Tax=Marmota monax TaxID=9995 RepID=A0A834UV43_MARMO|nr:putative serine protease 47 [Marmota monax]
MGRSRAGRGHPAVQHSRMGARAGADPKRARLMAVRPLLLLLSLRLQAASSPSPSQPPGNADELTGEPEDLEPIASGLWGYVGGAQGPFEVGAGGKAGGGREQARAGREKPPVCSLCLYREAGGREDDITQVCGKPKVIGKVYGGHDSVNGQWPWQASLLYLGQHLCGAVLIDALWLLSTAHCFLNKSQAPQDYEVLLGNTQLYQHTQHTQKMLVNQIITHPDFEKLYVFGSDIAMLQLHLPVNFTPYVVPVCLPHADMQLPSQTSCWITGWGRLSEKKPLLPPYSLQEAKVSLMNSTICNTFYGQTPGEGRNYSVQEEMLCGGDFSTGKAICQGDSGGPLVCSGPNAWVLVGLASWGLDCRHPIYPSIFTRVAYFIDWISKVRKQSSLPDPPPTDFPSRPLRASGCPGPWNTLMCTQTWLLLPFILMVQQQVPG